jgi:hypothetical protein
VVTDRTVCHHDARADGSKNAARTRVGAAVMRMEWSYDNASISRGTLGMLAPFTIKGYAFFQRAPAPWLVSRELSVGG